MPDVDKNPAVRVVVMQGKDLPQLLFSRCFEAERDLRAVVAASHEADRHVRTFPDPGSVNDAACQTVRPADWSLGYCGNANAMYALGSAGPPPPRP